MNLPNRYKKALFFSLGLGSAVFFSFFFRTAAVEPPPVSLVNQDRAEQVLGVEEKAPPPPSPISTVENLPVSLSSVASPTTASPITSSTATSATTAAVSTTISTTTVSSTSSSSTSSSRDVPTSNSSSSPEAPSATASAKLVAETLADPQKLSSLYELLSQEIATVFSPGDWQKAVSEAGSVVTNYELWGETVVSGDWAEQEIKLMTSSGQTVSYRMIFRKEADGWKLFGTI